MFLADISVVSMWPGVTHGVVDTQMLSLALIPSSVQQHLPGHGSASGRFPISWAFCKMRSQKQGVRSPEVAWPLCAHGGAMVLAAVV